MAEALSSQHTSTFPDLLNKALSSVVISTYQAGKLIILRSTGEALNTHFVSLAKPMGVAYSKNRLSVGSGVQVIDYFNMPSVGPKVAPRDTHDNAFLPRRLHYTGDIDIHEMGFADDEELWIVNTKMSCLGTLDLQHSFVPKWRPPFISGYDLSDRCHLNGLAMRDGKPRYVSSLGISDKPAGWREDKAFGGMIMDIETNEFVIQGLSMPHSPRWYRDQLWVLESGAGQLITVDTNTGSKTVIAQVPGFCRGIDFIDRYALIGLSEVRETAVFAGLPLTEREQVRKCGVWIIDIETGQTAGYLVFSSGVQEIFSVQTVPGRYPALLDLNDPLLATSYSLPDDAVTQFTPPDPEQLAFDQAVSLHRDKRLNEAVDAYKNLLIKTPNRADLLHNLGIAQYDLAFYSDAIESLSHCISIQRNHAGAQNALGLAYIMENNKEKAIEHFNLAIEADRQYASAYVNRASIKLTNGDFINGWADYEWRWQLPNNTSLNCQQPKWSGQDISGKTLLIHTEQNMGDAILFARFIPEVRRLCKRLIIVCPEPLRILFKALECVDEVRTIGALPADLFDVYLPLMSLPLVLKIDSDAACSQVPYLVIANEVVVPELTSSKTTKIGVALDSLSDKDLVENNALKLSAMSALNKDIGTANLFSLQSNLNSKLATEYNKMGLINLDQELVSLSHMAALIAQLDIVVTTNEVVAHLGGALGIPTVTVLPTNAGWQWGSRESRTDWYPKTHLIRMQKSESWAALISRATTEVTRMLAS